MCVVHEVWKGMRELSHESVREPRKDIEVKVGRDGGTSGRSGILGTLLGGNMICSLSRRGVRERTSYNDSAAMSIHSMVRERRDEGKIWIGRFTESHLTDRERRFGHRCVRQDSGANVCGRKPTRRWRVMRRGAGRRTIVPQ
jgi:hypothetical protein